MKIKIAAIIAGTLAAATCAFSLSGCGEEKSNNSDGISPIATTVKNDGSSDTLYVKKVENLPDDFVMGMDSSAVISLEESGVKYYDFDGKETDVFKVLADNGINTIRVRVWNNPYDSNGNGFGGGNCDINTALKIGKRANEYGMNLMLDFHYSDFWADPSKQKAPSAWAELGLDTTSAEKDDWDTSKADALYEYTKDCLTQLKDAGIHVNIVQVGNETNNGLAGETTWRNMATLMSYGSKAIREVYPEAKVAVHFANPEKSDNYKKYAKNLESYGVDYDIFASSYYPYWHGTRDNLQSLLSEIAETYDKEVMVAETSYAYTEEDTDFWSNTIGSGGGITKEYPFTVQGQANSVRNIIDTVANTTNGIGVCYWEGTWISVGGTTLEENKALWEKYGSGWASSYSAYYDPSDAGKYYGGCAVDNQAFFDENGKPLESLKVFSLVKNGNEIEAKADAIEDVNLTFDLNGEITLPDTVNAIMTDDSKKAIPVTWEKYDVAAMKSGGPAKYTIEGVADGMKAYCYVSMIEYNFLTNYSFEDDENKTLTPTGWTVVNNGPSTAELYVEEKTTDSLTGNNHFHFYSKAADGIDFNLEQEVTGLSAGKYKYSISIMGGDGGSTEIYAYVKLNGEIIKKQSMRITSYNEWDTAVIEGIEYNGTDTLTIGIYVKCSGANNGAWGKIDDAMLNSMT